MKFTAENMRKLSMKNHPKSKRLMRTIRENAENGGRKASVSKHKFDSVQDLRNHLPDSKNFEIDVGMTIYTIRW